MGSLADGQRDPRTPENASSAPVTLESRKNQRSLSFCPGKRRPDRRREGLVSVLPPQEVESFSRRKVAQRKPGPNQAGLGGIPTA